MNYKINLFRDGVIHPASVSHLYHKTLSHWVRYHHPMILDLPDLIVPRDENPIGTIMAAVKKWIIENNPYYAKMNPYDTITVDRIDFFDSYGRGRIQYFRRSKNGNRHTVCTTSYFTIKYEN